MLKPDGIKFPIIANIKAQGLLLIAEVYINEEDDKPIAFTKKFSNQAAIKVAGEYIQSLFSSGKPMSLEQWIAIDWK